MSYLKNPFNKLVPMVYDDSMSLYEWINKVVQGINDYVNGLDAHVDSKLDKSTYETDKPTFEVNANKTGDITNNADNTHYPTTQAVVNYVDETALLPDNISNDSDTFGRLMIYSSQFVRENYINKTFEYTALNTRAKDIFGAINECAALISNPNLYIATYGETTYQAIKDAVDENRTIVCVSEDGKRASLVEVKDTEISFIYDLGYYAVRWVVFAENNEWYLEDYTYAVRESVLNEYTETPAEGTMYSAPAVNEGVNLAKAYTDSEIATVNATIQEFSKTAPTSTMIIGNIATSLNGGFHGNGYANVILHKNGLAEIHYAYKVTSADTAQNDSFCGLDFKELQNKDLYLPNITPITGGSMTRVSPDGTISMQRPDAMVFVNQARSDYWMPAFVDAAGNVNAIRSSTLTPDTRVYGVAYGTYQV